MRSYVPTQVEGSKAAIRRVNISPVRHVITSEYPPQAGGVSDYTFAVAAGLAKSGEEVHVWCPACDGLTELTQGVSVHRDLGSISWADLRKVGRLLDEFPSPRHLLLQWVPHGYGYKSMNLLFCIWLWFRAAWSGDQIEIMVHEPYLPFSRRSWRQNAAALVHRVMAIVLLQKARKIFVAIPKWEQRLRPYALLRKLPFQWLPVLSNVPCAHDNSASEEIRERYAPAGKFLIGHFGTFGSSIVSLLEPIFDRIVTERGELAVLLIGIRSQEFRAELIARNPRFTAAVHATGPLPVSDLSNHLAACDLLVQPYPDGVSTRRGSFLACLSHGKPVVTTAGELTESFWPECGAVVLVTPGDVDSFVKSVERLLLDTAERQRLGEAARRLYEERFDVSNLISALRLANCQSV